MGYDALRVLQSCGDLRPRFVRVLDAFEVSGFVSNDDRRALLDGELDVDDLVSGWFTGDRTPRDPRRRVARQAAIVVGNALLRAASARVGAPAAVEGVDARRVPLLRRLARHRAGGARRATRSSCARGATRSGAPDATGCLGCDTDDSPAIARISNPELDYDLVMCNACGRFIKERPRRGVESFIVERALTTELDLAAEQRGLRI